MAFEISNYISLYVVHTSTVILGDPSPNSYVWYEFSIITKGLISNENYMKSVGNTQLIHKNWANPFHCKVIYSTDVPNQPFLKKSWLTSILDKPKSQTTLLSYRAICKQTPKSRDIVHIQRIRRAGHRIYCPNVPCRSMPRYTSQPLQNPKQEDSVLILFSKDTWAGNRKKQYESQLLCLSRHHICCKWKGMQDKTILLRNFSHSLCFLIPPKHRSCTPEK